VRGCSRSQFSASWCTGETLPKLIQEPLQAVEVLRPAEVPKLAGGQASSGDGREYGASASPQWKANRSRARCVAVVAQQALRQCLALAGGP
jgi:hypothetical protein